MTARRSRQKPVARGYRAIASALEQEIRDGALPQGAKFPSESELVSRFGVGRNTVREALRTLQDGGYLLRRKGARSIVASADPERMFVNSVSSVGELLDYARSTRQTLLTTESVLADRNLAELLDVEPGSAWVRLALIRSTDGHRAPFCYSEIFIRPAYGDAVSHFGSGAEIYTIIERLYGLTISRIDQEIEAASASANIASRLRIKTGAPCLRVRTHFHALSEGLVEVGLVHFPAGRYKVRLSLDRRTVPPGAG